MKKYLILLLVALSLSGCTTATSAPIKTVPPIAVTVPSATETVDFYFSPYEDCQKYWVETISSAKSEILVSCYGITNDTITQALITMKNKGVRVLVCIDKLQSKGRSDKNKLLADNGIEVVIKKTSALEHNKMIVVDSTRGIMGSWNLSGNAQGQDNGICVFNSPRLGSKAHKAILKIYDRDKEK